MELPLETYRLIARHVESKADLCTLCRVNKDFQRAAEWILYNTIHASDAWHSFGVCSLLSGAPRLAVIVESLTLLVSDVDDNAGPQSEVCLPNIFWPKVSDALRQMTSLRSLNLHLDGAGDTAQAWILDGVAFRLHRFHCDLQWDAHLVSFLNTQADIVDLYIADYSVSDSKTTQISTPSPLNPGALPNLSTLECTFAEAAYALIPTRPISRLKTCFSKTRLPEKREELSLLCSKLMETTCTLLSLDIADSSYSDWFCLEFLTSVVKLENRIHDLRYLGTLVLPVDGRARLKFYGLLRVLRSLECIEVEVSEWEPPPPLPEGLRALACELRIYCPSLRRVIFVHDFERTVVFASHGIYNLDMDSHTENIWNEF